MSVSWEAWRDAYVSQPFEGPCENWEAHYPHVFEADLLHHLGYDDAAEPPGITEALLDLLRAIGDAMPDDAEEDPE